MKSFGMLHVYTGTGKGKTSAALGLALRAIGHGARVIMICFMKSPVLTLIPLPKNGKSLEK